MLVYVKVYICISVISTVKAVHQDLFIPPEAFIAIVSGQTGSSTTTTFRSGLKLRTWEH